MIINKIIELGSYFIWPVLIFDIFINAWRLIQGKFSRKHAGSLVYKDNCYNSELVGAMVGGILVVFGIIVYLIFEDKKTWLDSIVLVIFLPFLGINAIKGLTSIEIWENGIFSKEGFVNWEDINYYQFTYRNKFNYLEIKTKKRKINLPINDERKAQINDLLNPKILLKY